MAVTSPVHCETKRQAVFIDNVTEGSTKKRQRQLGANGPKTEYASLVQPMSWPGVMFIKVNDGQQVNKWLNNYDWMIVDVPGVSLLGSWEIDQGWL